MRNKGSKASAYTSRELGAMLRKQTGSTLKISNSWMIMTKHLKALARSADNPGDKQAYLKGAQKLDEYSDDLMKVTRKAERLLSEIF